MLFAPKHIGMLFAPKHIGMLFAPKHIGKSYDYNRLSAQVWPPPLFDCGEKCIQPDV